MYFHWIFLLFVLAHANNTTPYIPVEDVEEVAYQGQGVVFEGKDIPHSEVVKDVVTQEQERIRSVNSQDPVRAPVIPKKVWREIRQHLKNTNPVSSVVQSVLDIPPPRDDNEEQHILLLVAVLLLAVLQLIFALLTMPMILHFYSRRVNIIGGKCGRKRKEEALV